MNDLPPSHDGEAMALRKERHLDICLNSAPGTIEGPDAGFRHVRFLHHALPELSLEDIDTSCSLFGYRTRLPLFISSMTGGSKDAFRVNQDLARIAQAEGIGVGMGSLRILFRKPEVKEHFLLKHLAPDVPVWANLGAVQVRDMVHDRIFEMIRSLEVDGIAIHLNPGQELFQPEGDRDFRGILPAIRRFCEKCPVPVMVKETGAGLHPAEVVRLLKAGARYVNIAGSGGTNWITVESLRQEGHPDGADLAAMGREFIGWGNPTALVLATLRNMEDAGRIPGQPSPRQATMPDGKPSGRNRMLSESAGAPASRNREAGSSDGILQGRVLASGGIRSGMDLAASLVLGAHAAGAALPVLRALDRDGADGARAWIRRAGGTLARVMLLTNCRNLGELRRSAHMLEPGFAREVECHARLFHA